MGTAGAGGDLGPEAHGRRPRGEGEGPPPAPVLTTGGRPIAEWLRPVEGETVAFRARGAGPAEDVTFVPFYLLHRRRYGIYWDLAGR